MTLEELEKSRGKAVRESREKTGVYLGTWYRPEDWNENGDLIATGIARLKVLDPWANDRAAGRPCPPLGSERMPLWTDYIGETSFDEEVVSSPEAQTVTKIIQPVTKIDGRGRPSKGDNPMSVAERMRALRARKAAKAKE